VAEKTSLAPVRSPAAAMKSFRDIADPSIVTRAKSWAVSISYASASYAANVSLSARCASRIAPDARHAEAPTEHSGH
jgi:hypothetical protein